MAFPVRTDRPLFAPHKCVVLSKGDDPNGWIDCGNLPFNQPDPRVYVSYGGVRTLALMCGWTAPEHVTERDQRIAELQDENRRLTAENGSLRERQEAIDVLASAGFVARKKPGRPKEKVG